MIVEYTTRCLFGVFCLLVLDVRAFYSTMESLEKGICNLKANMVSRGVINADKIFAVDDTAEPESYLSMRWYRDCKSCYGEPQKTRIHFNIGNKGIDLASKGLSNYTNRDDIKMLHHLLGYNPNGKKLQLSSGGDSRRTSALSMYTGSLSLLSLQKHHRKQEKVVLWGGQVDHEQMSKSSVSSSKHTFDKDGFLGDATQIRHLRGPLSHAAIVYEQLVLYEANSEVILSHIEDLLTRGEHGVVYGDKLLLAPLINGFYAGGNTAANQQSRAQQTSGSGSSREKTKICLIPDERDTVDAHELTDVLSRRRLHLGDADTNPISSSSSAGDPTAGDSAGRSRQLFKRFVPNTYIDLLVPPLEMEQDENPRRVSVFVVPPMPTRQLIATIQTDCAYVVSSSVYGAILADGLNVPNHWLYSPRTLRSSTSTWEYNDYALGVGRECNCHVDSIEEGIRRYLYAAARDPRANSETGHVTSVSSNGANGSNRIVSVGQKKSFALPPEKLSTLYSRMLAAFPYQQVCPVDTLKLYLAPVLPQTLATLNFDGDAGQMLALMNGLPLSVLEQKALLGALDVRADMELYMATEDPATLRLPMIRRVNDYFESRALRPLLCAVFLKAEHGAVDIFFKNVEASHGHCDWAVVAYGGSHSMLDRIKAEFSMHANQHADRGDGVHTGTHNHDYASLYPHYKVPKLVYCAFADEAVDVHGDPGAEPVSPVESPVGLGPGAEGGVTNSYSIGEGDSSSDNVGSRRRLLQQDEGDSSSDHVGSRRRLLQQDEGDSSSDHVGSSRRLLQQNEGDSSSDHVGSSRRLLQQNEGDSSSDHVGSRRRLLQQDEGDSSSDHVGSRRRLLQQDEGGIRSSPTSFKEQIKAMRAKQESQLQAQEVSKSRSSSRIPDGDDAFGGQGQLRGVRRSRGKGKGKGKGGNRVKGKGAKGREGWRKGLEEGTERGADRKYALAAQLVEAGENVVDRRPRRRHHFAEPADVEEEDVEEESPDGVAGHLSPAGRRLLFVDDESEQELEGGGLRGRLKSKGKGGNGFAGMRKGSGGKGIKIRRRRTIWDAASGMSRKDALADQLAEADSDSDSGVGGGGGSVSLGNVDGAIGIWKRQRKRRAPEAVEGSGRGNGKDSAAAAAVVGSDNEESSSRAHTRRSLLVAEIGDDEVRRPRPEPRSASTHIPKQVMFTYLTGIAKDYNKIWLLDEDISLVGFNIPQFLFFSNCHDRSAPETPQTQLLVTQPMIAQNTQDRISVSASYWEKLQNESQVTQAQAQGGSMGRILMGSYTGFVESQAPLFESNYFVWYTNFIIGPMRKQHLSIQSGWGAGHTNCKAAASYASTVLGWASPRIGHQSVESLAYHQPCAIMITDTPLIHLDTHALEFKTHDRKNFNEAGAKMSKKYRQHFPNWSQHGRPFGMLDPADPRGMVDPKSGGVRSGVIDQKTQIWKRIYKMPETYVSGKLICSSYDNALLVPWSK